MSIFKTLKKGLFLEPDAICDGFTKHSIEGTCVDSEADQASDNIINLQGENKMNREEFWTLIDSTLMARDQEEQLRLIKTKLTKLSEVEISSFHDIFNELLVESNKWSLLGAEAIITGYCSDDGFYYFRQWLISKGQSVFEGALKNADSLSGVITQRDIDENVSFEMFSYAIWDVYEEKTGRDNWLECETKPEPKEGCDINDEEEKTNEDYLREMGKEWEFDDLHEMKKRYPNLLSGF
jgi:hypothetical protein